MTSLPHNPPTGKPLSASQKELIRLLAEAAVKDFLEQDTASQAVEKWR